MERSITKSLSLTVCILAFCLSLLSCSKNSEPPAYCLAIVVPDTLRFNILSKESKTDLFFSTDAVYDTSEIELFRKEVNGNLQKVQLAVEKNWEDLHFYTIVHSSEIIFLKIGNQPLDTIAVTVAVDPTKPCPQQKLEQVKFNSEAPEQNAHGRIVLFYREE